MERREAAALLARTDAEKRRMHDKYQKARTTLREITAEFQNVRTARSAGTAARTEPTLKHATAATDTFMRSSSRVVTKTWGAATAGAQSGRERKAGLEVADSAVHAGAEGAGTWLLPCLPLYPRGSVER